MPIATAHTALKTHTATTVRVFLCALLLLAVFIARADAREIMITLDDGNTVKVFLFEPENHDNGPWPLTVLMPGGDGNEYVARAQFWLGRELARQGWMIAVPVATNGNSLTGERGTRVPRVIEYLQAQENIQGGKVLLVGVSSGGSAALELAAQQPQEYYGVVAVPGMLKDLSVIGDMQGLPVYLRVAEDDIFRWHRDFPALVNALTANNAQVNARLVSRGKHVFRLNWDELGPWIEALVHPPSDTPE